MESWLVFEQGETINWIPVKDLAALQKSRTVDRMVNERELIDFNCQEEKIWSQFWGRNLEVIESFNCENRGREITDETSEKGKTFEIE